jgi:hypothetical protein
MTRKKCTICLERGCGDIESYHEISYDGKYIHLCDTHFWMLARYFEGWKE